MLVVSRLAPVHYFHERNKKKKIEKIIDRFSELIRPRNRDFETRGKHVRKRSACPSLSLSLSSRYLSKRSKMMNWSIKIGEAFFRSGSKGNAEREDWVGAFLSRVKKRRRMTGGWYRKAAIPPQARPRQGERRVSELAARCRGEMLGQGEPRCYGIRTAAVP